MFMQPVLCILLINKLEDWFSLHIIIITVIKQSILETVCNLFICNFSNFPFWILRQVFILDCVRPWLLLTFL